MGTRCAPIALLLAAACVTGTGSGRATGDGRVAAKALPAGWRRIAVLPFAGPQHRRPCEEVLALRLAEQEAFAIVPPFAARRAIAQAGAGSPAPRWAALALDEPGRPAKAAVDRRDLARALAVDAVVAGAIVRSGAALSPSIPPSSADAPAPGPFDAPGVDLLLVDGSTARPAW